MQIVDLSYMYMMYYLIFIVKNKMDFLKKSFVKFIYVEFSINHR